MAEAKFIGIKKLWYGDIILEDLTASKLKTWLGTAKEVKNSHDGTFSYSQDDPQTQEYKNELTGKTYHIDVQDTGKKTITFTIGSYDYETKAALQGGTVIKEGEESVGWSAPTSPLLVYRAIVAQTKTGGYVVFTNANIVAKTNMADKNMGLGVTAVATDNDAAGVKDEYWFSGSAVDKE